MAARLPLGHPTRERLVKLCGRLGSSHAGERATAALKADELLRPLGLTWEDALNPPALPSQPPPPPQPAHHAPPPPPPWREPIGRQQAIEVCLKYHEVLNNWEWRFLLSISGHWRLSDKQSRKLDQIVSKCRVYASAFYG